MLPVTIRGNVLESGEPVFIRDDAQQVFIVANVEDGDEDQLLVSVPVPRITRRGESFQISSGNVLLAQEIDNKPITNDRLRGDLLIQPIACDRVAIVQVQESALGAQPTAVVRPVYPNADGSWDLVGEAEEVQSGQALPPVLFARIARWRYMQPVDPLFDILATNIGEAWAYEGSATLNVGGVGIPVLAKVTLEDDKRDIALCAHYTIASLIGSLAPEYFGDERLYAEGGPWLAHVAVDGASLGFNAEAGYRASISVIPRAFELSHSAAAIVATREVYIGAPIEAWSDPLYVREPPVPALGPQFAYIPRCIRLNLFGRPAIIYQPPLHADSANDEHRAVLHLGEPLSETQHCVLSTFLGFISGGRARNVLTETFAIDRKVKTTYHDRGLATEGRCPPIPINRPTPHATLMVAYFSQLLTAFERWNATDHRSFAAIFHHYSEGVDSNYPATRILRVAVALEALINLVTQDQSENEDIVDHRRFVALRDRLLISLGKHADQHRDVFPTEVEERYRTKIQNMNIASNTRRIRRFWELVPIVRMSEDDELLRRLRNDSVHRGFVGDDMSPEGLRKNARDADRLCDLFNRCVLAHADYAGPMLSATGRWLEPLSGEPFPLPQVPRGGTIELRMDTALPAFDGAEAAAVASLRRMQRTT